MDSNCTIHIKLGVPDELKFTTHQSQFMLVIPNDIKLTSDDFKLNFQVKFDHQAGFILMLSIFLHNILITSND